MGWRMESRPARGDDHVEGPAGHGTHSNRGKRIVEANGRTTRIF
jgi:hypothetical protein